MSTMPSSPDETIDLKRFREELDNTAVLPNPLLPRTVLAEACLVCIHSEDPVRGKRFSVGTQPLVIGRDGECAVAIADRTVSRRHALIEYRPGYGYRVTDLDSANGTYVNEVRVRTEALNDGSSVRVGNALFRFLAGGNMEAAYHEEIRRLTVTDPLTGVYNRRALDEFLERELARAVRHMRPLAVALFDIDHFKAINDRLGHLAGDRTLTELAARLRPLIRADELLARYGGEEFALVLPESTLERSVACAERFRRAVGERPFGFEGHTYSVTVSAGVGFLTAGTSTTATELLRTADARLYEAKRAGRNCVAPKLLERPRA
jgi:diguanylate cyclase (GGDEF)-like protein